MHVGTSSPFIRYKCLSWVCPVRKQNCTISSLLLRRNGDLQAPRTDPTLLNLFPPHSSYFFGHSLSISWHLLTLDISQRCFTFNILYPNSIKLSNFANPGLKFRCYRVGSITRNSPPLSCNKVEPVLWCWLQEDMPALCFSRMKLMTTISNS